MASFNNLEFTKTAGGELNSNCPFCEVRGKSPDEGKHLYINPRKGLYYCHRCQASGQVDDVKNMLEFTNNQSIFDLNRMYESLLESTVFTLDDLGSPILPNTEEYDYIVNRRKMRPEQITEYNMLKGYGDLEGRIVLPVYSENKIRFYFARSMNPNLKPKYMTPTGIKKSRLLFNFDKITTNYCFLCEGGFSSSAFGSQGVASLGYYLHDDQCEILASKCTTIYLVWDGEVPFDDTINKVNKINTARKLIKYGMQVKIVQLPDGKDPDDMKNTNELVKCVLDAIVVNKFNIMVYDFNKIKNMSIYNLLGGRNYV